MFEHCKIFIAVLELPTKGNRQIQIDFMFEAFVDLSEITKLIFREFPQKKLKSIRGLVIGNMRSFNQGVFPKFYS